jgi:type I restriction enzyme S subunit
VQSRKAKVEWVPLGEVAEIERVGVDPKEITEFSYVSLEDIDSDTGQVRFVARQPSRSTKFRFSPEHVLYGKLRPYLQKVARPSASGYCSTDILPIRPRPALDRHYLYHFLRTPEFTAKASQAAVGVNLPRLSPSFLSTFAIPLPPLSEQRRIAAILDKADELRAKRRAALKKLDELIQSIFLDMFGDPATNDRGWLTARVSDLCELVRGSSPRPQGDARFFGGPVPRLMVADITRDGWLVTPRIDSLTIEGAKQSRPIPAGTVVMAVSGNVGLVSRLAVNACIHDGFVAFTKLDELKCQPEFLLALLHFSKSLHEKHKAGAIFINLTTTDIKAMSLPIPPYDLQSEFSRRLNQVETLKTGHRRAVSEIDALFASLQHRAFRGEL